MHSSISMKVGWSTRIAKNFFRRSVTLLRWSGWLTVEQAIFFNIQWEFLDVAQDTVSCGSNLLDIPCEVLEGAKYNLHEYNWLKSMH